LRTPGQTAAKILRAALVRPPTPLPADQRPHMPMSRKKKSPEKKKRVFRPFICFFGYFNVFAPSTSFRHVKLMNKKEKRKK